METEIHEDRRANAQQAVAESKKHIKRQRNTHPIHKESEYYTDRQTDKIRDPTAIFEFVFKIKVILFDAQLIRNI